jgi:hypothetical protein
VKATALASLQVAGHEQLFASLRCFTTEVAPYAIAALASLLTPTLAVLRLKMADRVKSSIV